MNILEAVLLIAILATIAIIGIFVAVWLWRSRGARLMRCPETGSIACVEVWEASRSGGLLEPRVQWCDLWPRQHPCGRGCLKRYHETALGWRVNAEALRPYEHP